MNLKRKIVCGGAVLFGLAQAAMATPFSYTGPSALDVDSISVTNITLNVADTGAIGDLNVRVNIMGAYGPEGFPGNNNIWLSHNGVTVNLFNSTGVYGTNAGGLMDIVFDDEAALPVPTIPTFVGTFQAAGSLSAFDGLDLSGDWILSIQDMTIFPNEGDDLLAWSINGETLAATSVPEPTSVALLGLGLAAAAFSRRKKSI